MKSRSTRDIEILLGRARLDFFWNFTCYMVLDLKKDKKKTGNKCVCVNGVMDKLRTKRRFIMFNVLLCLNWLSWETLHPDYGLHHFHHTRLKFISLIFVNSEFPMKDLHFVNSDISSGVLVQINLNVELSWPAIGGNTALHIPLWKRLSSN